MAMLNNQPCPRCDHIECDGPADCAAEEALVAPVACPACGETAACVGDGVWACDDCLLSWQETPESREDARRYQAEEETPIRAYVQPEGENAFPFPTTETTLHGIAEDYARGPVTEVSPGIFFSDGMPLFRVEVRR